MKTHSLDYLDDLPSHRRHQLIYKDKAEDIARSQFWPDIAKELARHRKHRRYAIRLAALVFVVAAKTHKKHRGGKIGHKTGWSASATQWAKWIGLSGRHQIYRLLEQAQKSRLLNSRKTGTGLLVWLHKTSLYSRIKLDEHGKVRSYGDTCYFNHRDDGLSLAAGMILDKMKYYSEPHEDWTPKRDDDDYEKPPPKEPEGVRRNAVGWQRMFPFLSLDSIDKALHVIRANKLACLDDEGVWWFDAKAYTDFVAKEREKPASSASDREVPEATTQVPEATMQIPEATTKSPYQHHSNNEAKASVFAGANNESLPSPPAADDGQVCFASSSEDKDDKQKELAGEPVLKSMNDKPVKEEEEDYVPTVAELERQQEEEGLLKAQEEARRRRLELIQQTKLNKARDQEEKRRQEQEARRQEAKASVPKPAKPKGRSNYDRWTENGGSSPDKQEQAGISPDVNKSIQARLTWEEEVILDEQPQTL